MSESGQPSSALRYGPPQPPGGPAPDSAKTGGPRGVPAAIWPVAVLVVAGVVGAAVGVAVTALGTAGSDEDGFGELGAFLLGAALGVVAFAGTYLGGLAVAARRAFPAGRRILPFGLSLVIPALLVAVALALAAVADEAGADFPRAMGVVAFIGVAAAAPASFAWAGGKGGRRRLAVGTAAVVSLMVVTTAVGIGATRHRLAVAADRLPLVLFQGASADAPFEGWRRDEFRTITIMDDNGSIAPEGQRAYLKYFAPRGVVFVTMHTDLGSCRDTARYTCRMSGTLQGNEIRRYERIAEYGAYPRSDAFDVLVYADGSGVSVNEDESRDWPPRPRDFTTTQVLEGLVRVDRPQFERATGSKLRLS